MKKMLKKLIRREKGQALPMVLILMVLGGLIVAPLLTYTTSGLKVSQSYDSMASEFYAADAGIEDGLWQIKYDHLEDLFSNYERYNYDATYQYPITYPVDVNNIDVEVEIENIWIPDIPEPATVGEANWLAGTDKLIIAGGVSAELTQQLKIHYKKESGDPELLIETIGVWLPPGFSYDELGTSSLALEVELANAELTYNRVPYPHKGGEAVVWTFTEPAPFTALPGVSEDDNPMTCTFAFNFKRDNPESERNPEAASWITTSTFGEFTYTWDADVRVFHIHSFAKAENSITDGATINAYAIKSDPRQLINGRSGDYRAIGNTLMLDLYSYPQYTRDTLLSFSEATVDDIPANGQVQSAWLYWSAFVEPSEEQQSVFIDTGDFDIYQYWWPGSDWSRTWVGYPNGWAYRAHHGYNGDRELVLKEAIPLSIYESATLSFDYWKGGRLEYNDCLYYAISSDGGGTWSGWEPVFCDDQGSDGATSNPQSFENSIPEEYLTADFKVKFRIEGFDGGGSGGSETCYIDNIEITVELEEEIIADTEIRFKIDGNPVYLEEDEHGVPNIPAEGDQSIFARFSKVFENDNPETGELAGYSYCCKVEVTSLVQEYTENGNAIYTVSDVYGDVDSLWSYAGWSLIIVYNSPETQRHHFFFADFYEEDFPVYIKPHGLGVTFSVSGFLVPDPIVDPDTGELKEENAATITCFVGDGDDYWTGDFIAINPPEGAQGPDIPDSYKLFDGITLYAEWGWPWPSMDNTEYSPNNVWNGRSEGFGGDFIDGVDIDTFYVPWGDPPSDGLLKPGDSSATIVLSYASTEPPSGYGGAELINFIYIIIAFRSATVTGGTVTYIIEG